METMAARSRPNEPVGDFVLTLACPDRPGIVHAVTSFLMEHGGNIMESQQFGDQQAGRFFMRIDFEVDSPVSAETLRRRTSRPRRRSSRWTSSCGRPRRRTAR